MNEKKKNKNKGFSLVELIIVIAIMAILVAILAPQFLKYVERSRNTADIANAREISNAIIAYIADSEAENNTIEDGGTTVTVDKNEAKVWDNEKVLQIEVVYPNSPLTSYSSKVIASKYTLDENDNILPAEDATL